MSTAELPDLAAELAPDEAREILDRQARVLELIAAAAPLRTVLTEILSSLERLMPGARCSVLLLDREHQTLHHGAAPSLPPAYIASIDGMGIGETAGSCGTAATLNTAVIATDVRLDHRWANYRQLAEAAGLRSCWSTPIEGGDGLPVGTFAVYHDRPHRPTRREQQFVDRFSHLASVAIDHAGLIGDLIASEERFRRSFDDNSLGMAILDSDRVIVRSNTALAALARRNGDLVGRPLAEVVTPAYGTLESQLEEVEGDGAKPVAFEAVLHRSDLPQPDGVEFTGAEDVGELEVEVTISLLHGGPAGSPVQYVVNVFDLTERRAAERHRRARLEAETARKTAEELSHAKSELLTAVGHEARTPIQAIVGFAELLGTIDLDQPRRREALDHISAAAGHVMDLLAEVLDLSRIEAGALPVALERVCVREVVDEVFGLLSAKAEQRQVDLSANLADEVVVADRRRLRQVLLNLVGNSIRHGKSGGRVQVQADPAPDERWVTVSVDDDGPGIPADFLPRVFTAFARPQSSPAGPASTTVGDATYEESIGLGLGLAHGLVDVMGGELTVGNSTPEGTSMVLRLPREQP